MPFKILNISTKKIINRHDVRSARHKERPNLRDDPVTSPEVITSLRREKSEDKDVTSETLRNKHDPASETSIKDSSSPLSSSKHVLVVDLNDLVGRTLLLNKEGRQRLRDRVVKDLDNFEGNLARDSSHLEFICFMINDAIEETFAYN